MPRRRPTTCRAIALALGVGLVLGACGHGEPVGPVGGAPTTSRAPTGPDDVLDLVEADFVDATGASVVDIEVRDNEFVAPFTEVRAGTTVRFTNRGSHHDVRPADPRAFAPIAADDLGRGSTAEVVLTEPGDVVFYCSIHGTPRKGMVGALRVIG